MKDNSGHSEGGNKTRTIRAWDKEGKYIGDFEVPETTPLLVRFGENLYDYNGQYNVYIQQKDKPFDVGMLWTGKVKVK